MVKVLNHALIKHKLSIMREEKTSNYIFKQNLDEIAMLMAYEVTKDYPLKEKEMIDKIRCLNGNLEISCGRPVSSEASL